MIRRKVLDQGPLVTPEGATLLDYIQWVEDPDPHWQAGITYPEVCSGASTTYDICVTDAPPVTGDNPTKENTGERGWRGATPFTVYTRIDCSPVGWVNDAEGVIRAALLRFEHLAVEEVFTTGVVAGVADIMYPHLSADTEVLDPDDDSGLIVLQPAASVAVTGTVDVVEGLGILEQQLADCYGAQGFIHVTLAVFNEMVNELIVFQRNGRWFTAKGNTVVPGSGYTGQAPDGTAAPAGTSWMYATGAVFGRRTAPKQVGNITESLDRGVNTLEIIIERTYVIGWDCCLAAVRVSTGGAVTGTASSAT